MAEELKFDLMGERGLRFDPTSLTLITRRFGIVPLPAVWLFVKFTKYEPIPYRDIRWIGRARRFQWWTVGLVLTLGLLGLLWIYWGLRDADLKVVVVGLIWFALWGAWPAYLFAMGRWMLVIATEDRTLSFPMDRRKRAIRRTIELLRERCPPGQTHWELGDESRTMPSARGGFDPHRPL